MSEWAQCYIRVINNRIQARMLERLMGVEKDKPGAAMLLGFATKSANAFLVTFKTQHNTNLNNAALSSYVARRASVPVTMVDHVCGCDVQRKHKRPLPCRATSRRSKR